MQDSDNIKVSGGVENDVMAKVRKGLPVRRIDWLSGKIKEEIVYDNFVPIT